MSNFDFTLGSNDRVSIALRSHRPGEESARKGKAKLRVGGLSCAIEVEFEQNAINAFRKAIRRCHDRLKGTFVLRSVNGSFALQGEMAPHGHARVSIHLDRTLWRQRDDPQWDVTAKFICSPDDLAKLLSGLSVNSKTT